MRKPLVSIGLPTYNRATDLDLAIRSVLSQTYENIECLVSDNNSSDNTCDVLEKYKADKRVRININKTNIGMKENFQKVLEMTRGKYFLLLSDDDLLIKTAVDEFLLCFDKRVDVVISNVVLDYIETGKRKVINYSYSNPSQLLKDYFSNKVCIYPSSTMFDTIKLKAVGYLANEVKLAVDAFVLMKMFNSGHTFLYYNKPLVIYRVHSSLSSSHHKVWEQDFNELLNLTTDPEIRKRMFQSKDRAVLGYLARKLRAEKSLLSAFFFVLKNLTKIFKFNNVVYISKIIFRKK